MECASACFSKTLHYESPAHGGWGVIRVAALVPEMHMLFVAPSACGRHGALGGIMNGVKDKVSYLFIDEKGIVSGDYEQQIPQAVAELFAFLQKQPRVLFLFVSCLDDMLGTDHEALLETLSAQWPQVQFRTCHMNPIQSDTALPPLVTLNRNIYSLLRVQPKTTPVCSTAQINLIGNNVPPHKDGELYRVLAQNGITVRHIQECTSFDEYCTMNKSCLNLVLSPVAAYAARDMEANPGIPYQLAYISYNPQEIRAWYATLAQKLTELGKPVAFSIESDAAQAEASLRETAALLRGTPIALDFQAVKRTCSLAKTLIQYGFTVALLAIDTVLPFEKADFAWLQEHAPHLEVASPLHHDSPKFAYRSYSNCLCIGFDAGYMTGSTHVVNIMDDEGNFGFNGILRLMKHIQAAYHNTANVPQMIREAKLVV